MRTRALVLTPAVFALMLTSSPYPGGSLRSTAPMNVPRAAHTMTALPAGGVLVVGGFGAVSEREASPLLFNAKDMRFQELGDVVRWRHSHSASLLPDGTVLIAGGYGSGNSYLRHAEVFDPRTRTSRRVGDLTESRAGHVATLLVDGRILITGGVGEGWTFLATAEIYDPETARFTATGRMSTARESHVAIGLSDGRVLVAGGHGGTRTDLRVTDSAEIYDPLMGEFAATGPMTIKRHKHDAAALPDGRVLVLGGADERDSRGVYSSTELFDPTTGRFLEHVPMRLGRYKHAGTTHQLPDGRLLLAGGASRPEVYEPTTQRFRSIATSESLSGLFSAAQLLADGRVLITGGYSTGTAATSGSWIFQSS